MSSLYQRIGGYEVLDHSISEFYQLVLCDRDLNTFFIENMSDLARLHKTMVDFLSGLMGGPDSYKGPDMVTLHKNMKIKKEHFDLTWKHMKTAFEHNKISEKHI